MRTELYAYAACIVVYRVVESLAMRRAGSYARRPRRDWTMALIVVPYYLVLVAPLRRLWTFRSRERRRREGDSWGPGMHPAQIAVHGGTELSR
jgi:hypothetical protein